MRPKKLTMQAFGSYIYETIDFTKAKHDIFLICGDTGSGKTTIFDAIVYALYGSASGDRSEFVTQYSGNGKHTETYVELEFTCDDHYYRIKRFPAQDSYNKSGKKNKTAQGHKVEFYIDGEPFPSSKIDEVNEEIVNIVKLTRTQFMNVAMIAQGKFRELISSGKSNKKGSKSVREEIYSELFGADIFNKITGQLDTRQSAAKNEKKSLCDTARDRLSQIECPEDFSLFEEFIREKTGFLQYGSERTLDGIIPILEQLCEFLRCRQKQDTAEKKRISDQIIELNNAKEIIGLFNAATDAQKRYDDLKKTAEQIADMETLAEKIDVSYEIKSVFDIMEKSRGSYEECCRGLADQQENEPDLAETANLCIQAYTDASEAYRIALGEFTATESKVNDARSKFGQIAKLEKEKKDAEKELDEAKKALKNAETAKSNLEIQIHEQQKNQQAFMESPVKQSECKGCKETAEKLLEDFEELDEKQAEISEKSKELEEKQADLNIAWNKYVSQRNIVSDLEEQRNNSIAGILAENLRPGTPCPVCGSVDHPSPHIIDNAEEISIERIKVEKDEENRLHDIWHNASEIVTQIDADLNAIKESREEFLGKCREAASNLMEKDCYELDTAQLRDITNQYIGDCDDKLTVLDEECEKLKVANDFLSNVEERNSAIQEKIRETNARVSEANESIASSNSAIATAKSDIGYDSEEAARSALSTAEKKRDNCKEKVSTAESAKTAAEKALQECRTLIMKYTKDMPSLEMTLKNDRDKYAQSLTEKQMSEEEWQSLTQCHEKSEVTDLRNKAAVLKEALTSAKSAAEQAKEAIKEKEFIDPEKNALDLKKANESLVNIETRLRNNFADQYSNHLEWLRKRNTKLKDAMKEFDTASKLYKLFSGTAKKEEYVGGTKMSLQQYALRYYLGQILISANKRFDEMTDGQFRLELTSLKNEDSETSSDPLDLMVYSNVTGKRRSASSLSGGESFMAALSLALGTADVVSNSGNVELGVLFIDEGFGSLDDTSRKQAVKVLEHLAAHDKLVAVISHVSELKSTIDEQLIITKNDKGSHADWAWDV